MNDMSRRDFFKLLLAGGATLVSGSIVAEGALELVRNSNDGEKKVNVTPQMLSSFNLYVYDEDITNKIPASTPDPLYGTNDLDDGLYVRASRIRETSEGYYQLEHLDALNRSEFLVYQGSEIIKAEDGSLLMKSETYTSLEAALAALPEESYDLLGIIVDRYGEKESYTPEEVSSAIMDCNKEFTNSTSKTVWLNR